MQQKDIWEELSSNVSQEEVQHLLSHPQCFHFAMKNCIQSLLTENNRTSPVRTIEAGSQFGTNSFILDEAFDKTLLDIDKIAINKAKEAFGFFGKSASFLIADMFQMPVKDKNFDIVFNAGVLEHFASDDIIKALEEYKRVLKDDGYIVIGLPNHYGFVYRCAYLLLRLINKWSFPTENKIYDLQDEISKAGLILRERKVLCKENIFAFWGRLGFIFEYLDKFFNFQGYLTVLIIQKKNI